MPLQALTPLQALNVLEQNVPLGPAKPVHVFADDWVERIDELALPKLSAGEGRRNPALSPRRTRRPPQRRADVDQAAHLPMRRDLDRLHRYFRGVLRRRRRQRVKQAG